MPNKTKEYKVNGWLKIKTRPIEGQIMVEFYLGDDGFWSKTPIITCDSHWIAGIISTLQDIDFDITLGA